MRITIHVPAALRNLAEDAPRIEVEPTDPTVSAALAALFASHPALRDRLITETGQLRPHVAIFVGTESIRWTGGLGTGIVDGDEITVVPAVSGG